MKNFYDCATDRASRDAYRAALESLPFNRMLDRNGRENWFAIDNYMDEELMKNYFYDENSLYKHTITVILLLFIMRATIVRWVIASG